MVQTDEQVHLSKQEFLFLWSVKEYKKEMNRKDKLLF